MNNSAGKVMLSAGDMFNKTESDAEEIQQIPVELIHLPPNTPFKPYSEERMEEMVDSVRRLGVLEPVLLRPRPSGGYEVVAGANRTQASRRADRETVPAIVREMDDDTATLIMVDTNLKQRETLLPSEKAWAYRRMLEAMSRQGERTDLTSRQVVAKLRSTDIIGEESGESGRQVERYIRLTYLNTPLLELVDQGMHKFTVGVALSYLSGEEQEWLRELLEEEHTDIAFAQANKMKALSAQQKLTRDGMEAILRYLKPEPVKITLKENVLKQYFPADVTSRQMEAYIIKLLEKSRDVMRFDPIFADAPPEDDTEENAEKDT